MRAPDVLGLLDHVIFNILACNTDAHAKNYSLMISGRGFTLAPIYDVMCASAWEGTTRNLAQKVAGKNRGEHLKRRHWQSFAAECGLNAPRLMKRVEELAQSVLRQIKPAAAEVDTMPAGTHVLMPQFVVAIETRARAIILGLDRDGDEDGGEADKAEPAARRQRRKKAKAATLP